MTQWAYGGQSSLDLSRSNSPYQWYRENAVGNPDVKWETVKKLNVGVDYAVLKGLFAGSLEFFKDKEFDILVDGSQRSVHLLFRNYTCYNQPGSGDHFGI